MGKVSKRDIFDEKFLNRLKRLAMVAKRLSVGLNTGVRRSRRIGDGLEFADHRDYTPGDDMRFVDWPYYARMERLLLRLFHEHSESEVAILLDVSGSMASDEQKYRFSLRAAAALAYVAMAGLDRVRIQPFAEVLSDCFQGGRSRANLPAALDFLVNVSPGSRTQLLSCVKHFVNQSNRPDTVLIVSDLLDCNDELSDSLALLRSRACDVTVMHVWTQNDASPSDVGPLGLVSAETGETMNVDATEDLLASYATAWETFITGCQRCCLSRGAIYVGSPSKLGVEKLVLNTLRRAGVLSS